MLGMNLALNTGVGATSPGTESIGMIAASKIALSDQASRLARKGKGLAKPEDLRAVREQLLAYLQRRYSAKSLTFLKPPVAIPHGWETYTFQFQLRRSPELPAEFTRPLILRIYASPVGAVNARHECNVENYLAPLGFPVVRCLFVEEDARIFGGPFLVSEKAEGELFPDYLYHHPWRILELPRSMGCLHAELHQIPVERALAPARPFLDRHLTKFERLVREHDLAELRSGLHWLEQRRPEQTTPSAIVHLDFHPLNLLYEEAHGFTVLDWSQVDIGDRHADVAVTRMFMDCMQIERPTWWERFNYWGGRLLLRRGYQAAYEQHLQLNPVTLNYYSAWAAFRRLCIYGAWLTSGPAAHGSKPASLGNLTQAHIDSFSRYFAEHTGVTITLRMKNGSLATAVADKSIVASPAILG
jgi:aminoglycoside phosphotransferase (APT) family kinase protein